MATDSQILLRSDTNELEIVEFCIDEGTKQNFFGVNVAKVREIASTSIFSLPTSRCRGWTASI